MFQTKVVETIETHILRSITPPPGKSCRSWDNLEKGSAGQATDDNMAHAHCMLDTEGYKHILTICSTYYFSTATMVARTRLSVTIYVQCLPVISLSS